MKLLHRFKPYRNRYINTLVITFLSKLVLTVSLILGLCFSLNHFIYIPNLILVARILLILLLLSAIFLFIKQIKTLFGKSWFHSILMLFKEENSTLKPLLYNLYDIEQNKESTELQKRYYQKEIHSIHLKTDHKISTPWFINLILFVFIQVLLYQFVPSYALFTKQLMADQSKSNLSISTETTTITIIKDSTETVHFNHNINDLISLNYEINSFTGRTQKVYLSPNDSTFTFVHDVDSGKIVIYGYSALFGEVQSEAIQYNVIEPLQLIKHDVSINYPKYTRLGEKNVANINRIEILKGSTLTWKTHFNKPYKLLTSNFTHDSLNQSFYKQIIQPLTFQLSVIDNDSLISTFTSEPFELLTDQKPILVQKSPQDNHNVSSMNPVYLELAGFDDFGFSKINLEYYTKNTLLGYQTEPQQQTVLKHLEPVFQKQIQWQITHLNLFPGMDIYYRFIGWDNNKIDGYAQTETAFRKIHLLSMEEIFAAMNQKQEEIQEKIQENISQRKEILNRIDQLNRKLKQKNGLKFQEKKELENLLNKLKQLNKQSDQTKKSLNQLEQEFKEKNMFSEETLQKFEELKQLLENLNLPKQEIEKAQKSLDQAPSELKKNLDDLLSKEKNIQNEMDRAKSLLEKMKEKQKEEFVLKQLEEFQKNQENIANITNEQPQKANKEQRQLTEKFKQFEENTTDVSFKKELKKQQLSSKMQQSNQQNKQHAQKTREELTNDLEQLKHTFQEEIQKREDQKKQDLLEKMATAIEQLLYLSFQQEALSNTAKNLSVYSSEFREMISKQNLIRSQIHYVFYQLEFIAKESFLFNPTTLTILEKAIESTDGVIDDLEQRRNHQASQKQTDLFGSINQSILILQQNKNKMASSSSALGEKEFQEQMKQMAQQQQGVNNQTQSLWDMLRDQANKTKQGENGEQRQQGKNNSGQNGQQSVGDTQESLSKQFSDLLENAGNALQNKGQGRHAEMLNEMKAIADELKQKKLTQELINRQKKLLQKMLNASNSGRERDEEQTKREKELAKEFDVTDIKGLDKTLGQGDINLQEAFERAMSLPYSDEVKAIIENYYNNLIQKSSQTSDDN